MHINCSGLARPMICAGYVFLDLPRTDSFHGDEGMAAAEYLERLLSNKPLGEVSSKGYYFDDDIKFYMLKVAEDIKTQAVSEVICEQKINWQTRSGMWIKGRYDVSYIDEKGRLCIDDLKYGWGIVEIEENWQLIGYAIGEVIRRGQAFKEISLKIRQPRPHHEDGETREWVITYEQLLEYKERIERRMDEISKGKIDFQTSKHCKYCLGSGEACPAFNRLFYRALEISTEFHQDSIDNDELAQQLKQIERAEETIKIKKDSLTELAILRIRSNKIIPGYVQSERYGNRDWKKGIGPEAIKIMTGLDVIEKNFMTPAKAEKVGISRDLINQLSEKKFLGLKLEKKNTTKIGNKIFGTEAPKGR